MKRLVAIAVAMTVVLMGSMAFAQQNEETPSQFVDFKEGTEVEGGITVPGATRYDAPPQTRFDPLVELDTSFIENIKDSSNDEAL